VPAAPRRPLSPRPSSPPPAASMRCGPLPLLSPCLVPLDPRPPCRSVGGRPSLPFLHPSKAPRIAAPRARAAGSRRVCGRVRGSSLEPRGMWGGMGGCKWCGGYPSVGCTGVPVARGGGGAAGRRLRGPRPRRRGRRLLLPLARPPPYPPPNISVYVFHQYNFFVIQHIVPLQSTKISPAPHPSPPRGGRKAGPGRVGDADRGVQAARRGARRPQQPPRPRPAAPPWQHRPRRRCANASLTPLRAADLACRS